MNAMPAPPPSFLHRQRWRLLAWGLAAGLVLLPLLAMRLTTEVDWSRGDFVFAAILIGGSGLAFELAVRMSTRRAYRAGAAIGVLGCLLTLWINAAVGILGSEDNPQNLAFFAVVGTAAVGALLARFRARGLGYAMLATAAVQLAVFFVAWALGWGWILPITVFFCAFWLSSAALFHKAAKEAEPGGVEAG